MDTKSIFVQVYPCGSKSGLVFLDWCDRGEAGEAAAGKRFRNCLILEVQAATRPSF